MKKISVVLSCSGIGDILSSIPSIKYLYKIYGYNIPVFTHNVDIFKNFPYIDVYHFDDYSKYENDFDIVSTFQVRDNVHTRVDIRQLHARSLNIELLPEEMELEYYTGDYESVSLPNNYVVIHPVKTWPSRTWSENNWQLLVDKLIDFGINVVMIGKDSSEIGTYNISKPTFDIKGGLSLVNKLSIDQTWDVINRSNMVITMDSGILHLAGCTDTYILQLGSSINPKFRMPYRNGRQSYKLSYVLGDCELYCASDLRYGVKIHNDHRILPPIPFCLDDDKSIGDVDNCSNDIYRCHPSVDKVFDKVIDIHDYYNFSK